MGNITSICHQFRLSTVNLAKAKTICTQSRKMSNNLLGANTEISFYTFLKMQKCEHSVAEFSSKSRWYPLLPQYNHISEPGQCKKNPAVAFWAGVCFRREFLQPHKSELTGGWGARNCPLANLNNSLAT